MAILAASVAIILGGVQATASCIPGRTDDYPKSHWSWWQRNLGTTVGGVYANIYTYEPYVAPKCGQSQPCNETVEQVGVIDRTDPSSWIAQDGFETYEYGLAVGLRDFCEYTSNTIFHKDDGYIDNNPNALISYGILWAHDYSGGQPIFTCQKQGNTFDYLYYSTTPNTGQIFGEPHTFASQLPGGTNVNDYFSNAHIWFNGGWQEFGAHSAGNGADLQCDSIYPGVSTQCAAVNGPGTIQWNGGSAYNSNVYGNSVFEANAGQDQLNIADLACPS